MPTPARCRIPACRRNFCVYDTKEVCNVRVPRADNIAPSGLSFPSKWITRQTLCCPRSSYLRSRRSHSCSLLAPCCPKACRRRRPERARKKTGPRGKHRTKERVVYSRNQVHDTLAPFLLSSLCRSHARRTFFIGPQFCRSRGRCTFFMRC